MPRYRSAYLPVKRMMDLTLSIVALPIVLPILLIASIAIRLDTRGPALFIQERIGAGFETNLAKSRRAKTRAVGPERPNKSRS